MDTSSWATMSSALPTQSASALLPLPQKLASTASASDTLLAVSRQVSYVQRELQRLLDAQSAGLLSGLGKEQPHTSPPSSRPSPALSIRTPSQSPPGPINLPASPSSPTAASRRPAASSSSISLRAARSSIYRALLQLSNLKISESSALSSQQDNLSAFLSSLDTLSAKKKGIEDSIKEIEAEGSSRFGARGGEGTTSEHSSVTNASALQDEEARLSSEIHSLETRLYELKARLSHVRRLRQERENRLAARLSSWKGALTDVEKAIQRDILEGRGLEDIYPSVRNSNRRRKEVQGIWALPRERRTVELVKEEVESKVSELGEKKDGVEKEGMACVEGADIWKATLRKVEALETKMAVETGKLNGSNVGKGKNLPGDLPDAATEGMEGIVKLMGKTIEELEEEVTTVEGKGWNLLVCAIGAELEALKQGRDMLLNVLNSAAAPSDGVREVESSMMTARSRFSEMNHKASDAMEERGGTHDGGVETELSHPLVDFVADQHDNAAGGPAVEMQSFGQHTQGSADLDDDDEGPGPEFLLEHVDHL